MKFNLKASHSFFKAVILSAIFSTSCALADTHAPALWPGLQPDGSMLLPNQWTIRPAGKHVELGDFPVNMSVHPGGKYVAVLHSGYSQHEVIIVDLQTQQVAARANLAESFYGVVFSHDGKKLYCSGSSGEQIFAFDFADGKLSGRERIKLRDVSERGVPVGLALDADDRTLYAANLWNNRVSEVTLQDNSVHDVALISNAAPTQVVAKKNNEDFDTAAANKRAEATEFVADNNGVYPYGCVVDSRRDRLYVSLWGGASVAVLDLKSGEVIGRWSTGSHPCDLVLSHDGKKLFVANANENTVTVLDTQSGRAVETLSATLYPQSPLGSTPNSIALSPDDKLLFVANANINAVAVFDLEKSGESRSLGFIPTGWYPTCVRVTPDGRHLLITNGKGNVARANPEGPQPTPGRTKKKAKAEYIADLFVGTLSIVDIPPRAELDQRLAAWTAEVLKCSPLRPDFSATIAQPAGNPVPAKVGDPSPITHCIYIIKENRTYDQVFGDLPQGNGDPKLCLFPDQVTPNLHKLVREFVLLDNFYADAEVSADGHEWSMAAYASDYVEKTWPLNYGHKKSNKFPYPSEGVFPISWPSSGYIWDRAREAGITYRSYGEFVQNAKVAGQPATTHIKALQGHYDPLYRSFDLDYKDADRAGRFLSEMKRYEKEGDMPRLQIVRLPNDHTHGVSAGKLTPTAYVAENDAALGKLVEGVSRSKFWPTTAIFVIEDDAQNGPDHVDAHRTEALVISPLTKHGAVDSTLYSTSSMLRTIELILGLKPMTQFDAAANPMYNSFQSEARLQPFVAVPANADLSETNALASWGQKLKLNFKKEDAINDFLFSEIIWRSVKKDGQPMPAPVHSGFVMTHKTDDDD
ncbi:MAG TPA: SMP-30/gluconolactonase/LRE family protein [Verrucomicrobiae bacterium]|nr:SMP-30/gluconolactonase/LRE family protein [Verrucomicrobiae bacterium]